MKWQFQETILKMWSSVTRIFVIVVLNYYKIEAINPVLVHDYLEKECNNVKAVSILLSHKNGNFQSNLKQKELKLILF